jgi:hypothetical protein
MLITDELVGISARAGVMPRVRRENMAKSPTPTRPEKEGIPFAIFKKKLFLGMALQYPPPMSMIAEIYSRFKPMHEFLGIFKEEPGFLEFL